MSLILISGRSDKRRAFDTNTGLIHYVAVDGNDNMLVDYGPIEMVCSSIGRDEIRSAKISCGATATATVIDISALADYAAGDSIRVIGWYITAGTASGSYVFKSNATAKTGVNLVGINGGGVVPMQFDCAADQDLVISTVSSTVEGLVNYLLIKA